MKTEITGNIIVVGNNIDTDQIYPGRFLAITDPKEIGSHCLCGVDENIAANFPQGGIVVAGTNFGCGSSREHAPIALLNMGASAVIADSFARIFFRNSINLGLSLIVCKGIRRSQVYTCDRLGDQAMKILEAGGIKPMMRARMEKENAAR